MRLRLALAALLTALALAGCTADEAAEPAPSTGAPGVTLSSASTTAAPATPALTDTLYLLDAPHLAARAPTGAEPIRTPVPPFSALAVGQQTIRWTLPDPGLGILRGNGTVWVEVQGNVANPPSTSNCFWTVSLGLIDPNGEILASTGACVAEADPVVPAGVRELHLEWAPFDVREVQGADRIMLWVSTFGEPAPGARIDVLSGSEEFPSRFSLGGLALPLDTRTYL